jgi:hypothetical protein
MFQTLIRLASELDELGCQTAADRVDTILSNATKELATKDEMSSMINWHKNRDAREAYEDPYYEDNIKDSHQRHLDKKNLLEDFVDALENNFGKSTSKSDRSDKIIDQQIGFVLPGGTAILAKISEQDEFVRLLVKIQHSGKEDYLTFPLAGDNKIAGPAWLNTVAQTVINKILQRSEKTTNQ